MGKVQYQHHAGVRDIIQPDAPTKNVRIEGNLGGKSPANLSAYTLYREEKNSRYRIREYYSSRIKRRTN